MRSLIFGFGVLAALCFSGAAHSKVKSGAICNTETCAAYCQGFCDNTALRCRKSGSGTRECRGRGYRSCMNGCFWEICKLPPGKHTSYQCKRHPDLLQWEGTR